MKGHRHGRARHDAERLHLVEQVPAGADDIAGTKPLDDANHAEPQVVVHPARIIVEAAAKIRDMEPDLPTGTNSTKLFEDKTPNAIILNRILLNSLNVAAHDDLAQPDGSELIDLIVLLSRKLLSVWTHLQAYQAQ